MGNLLNAPVLEKDTHVGRTVDQYFQLLKHDHDRIEGKTKTALHSASAHSSPDGNGLHYGISSMQGWRIHMEDAHIAQPFLFAEEVMENKSSKTTTPVATTDLLSQSSSTHPIKNDRDKATTTTINTSSDGDMHQYYDASSVDHSKNNHKHANNNIVHPLHNHSLFAIFDGHGGKYAANFSSQNLLRILSRNSNFVQYAKEWNGRSIYLENLKRNHPSSDADGKDETNNCVTSGTMESVHTVDKTKSMVHNTSSTMESTKTTRTTATTIMTKVSLSASNKNTKLSTIEPAEVDEGATPDNDIAPDGIEGALEVEVEGAGDGGGGGDDDDDDNNNDYDDIDERQKRLRQLKKRGYDCDDKVRAMKDQVRRCFDGCEEDENAKDTNGKDDDDKFNGKLSDDILTSNIRDIVVDKDECRGNDGIHENGGNGVDVIDDDDDTDGEYTDFYYRAEAAYDRRLMSLLESSLRDAFLDLDAEMLAEMHGFDDSQAKDTNSPYGVGYELVELLGCARATVPEGAAVGHLPKEHSSEDVATMEDEQDDNYDDTGQDNHHPTTTKVELDAGTTAVVVLITPKWIVCANAGDSRAVYSRSSHRSVPLSYDHKPSDEAEERRIRNAGGYVAGGRIEADLAVSRGLGDFRFKILDVVASGAWGEEHNRDKEKRTTAGVVRGGVDGPSSMRPSEQKVSPVPDIIVHTRDPKEDEFVVLACDGIWDVVTNQECINMVAEIFAEGETDMGLVCEEILDQCLNKGSKDNMTAAVIKFPKQSIGKGRGVLARREHRDRASS